MDPFNDIEAKFCLIGCYHRRANRLSGHATNIDSVVQIREGYLYKDLDANLFVLQFFHETDIKRVMDGSPWSFNKKALIIR